MDTTHANPSGSQPDNLFLTRARLIQAAFDYPLEGRRDSANSQRRILVFLLSVGQLNDGKTCQSWYSPVTIQQETGLTQDAYYGSLKKLRNQGLLTKQGKIFFLDLTRISPKTKFGDKPISPKQDLDLGYTSPKNEFGDKPISPKQDLDLGYTSPTQNTRNTREDIYGADAHEPGKEEAQWGNVAKIRAKHDTWLTQRRDRISKQLDQLNITDTAARAFCLDVEYIDHIESVVFCTHYSDHEQALNAILFLRDYQLPQKRSQVIETCLVHLQEKDIFADAAIKTVFRSPYQAWDIIGGCNWERTTGKKLVRMLVNGSR